ncbi:hypothetical protein HK102_000170 [Quaeritorhiza haematococci]|nr:hypothetical protein HK102_000170 [Quaeritorhiza haematococci]
MFKSKLLPIATLIIVAGALLVTSNPPAARIVCGTHAAAITATLEFAACASLGPFCVIGVAIVGASLGGLCNLMQRGPAAAVAFPRAENATDIDIDMSSPVLRNTARYSDQEIVNAVFQCHNMKGTQVCVNRDVLTRAGQVTGGARGCTSGHMRCVNDQIFTTCVHGEWQVRQFCGQGTRCQKHSDPNYIMCGW